MLETEDFKDITTFHDAVLKLYAIDAISDTQLNELTGFGMLPGARKGELVGVPFLIVQFDFKIGKNESSFVECYVVTTNDQRYLLRDSSRGIHEQLRQIQRDRVAIGQPVPNCGYYARKGLTYKDNPYESPDGEKLTSRTYYLS